MKLTQKWNRLAAWCFAALFFTAGVACDDDDDQTPELPTSNIVALVGSATGVTGTVLMVDAFNFLSGKKKKKRNKP